MFLSFDLAAVTVGAVAAMMFAACTSGSNSCPSMQAQDCVQSSAFVDCGGTAEPVFACTDSGVCKWYEGVCPPAGSDVSPCPASDLCCENDWPFPQGDWLAGQSGSTGGVFNFLSLWGTEPWDQAREAAEANVDVVVDPSLSGPAMVDVTCSGISGDALCDPNLRAPNPMSSLTVSRGPDGWHISAFTIDLGEEFLIIKVVAEGPQSRALVCRQLLGDGWVPSCSSLPDSPVCASSGTLTVSALPGGATSTDSIALNAEVTFPDGGMLTVQL